MSGGQKKEAIGILCAIEQYWANARYHEDIPERPSYLIPINGSYNLVDFENPCIRGKSV